MCKVALDYQLLSAAHLILHDTCINTTCTARLYIGSHLNSTDTDSRMNIPSVLPLNGYYDNRDEYIKCKDPYMKSM